MRTLIRFLPGGKRSIQDILDVYDIEPSNMSFTVRNSTDTTHVTTASDNDNVSSVELDETRDFALLYIVLDCIIGTDLGVGVSDSTSVVSDDERDTAGSDLEFFDWNNIY